MKSKTEYHHVVKSLVNLIELNNWTLKFEEAILSANIQNVPFLDSIKILNSPTTKAAYVSKISVVASFNVRQSCFPKPWCTLNSPVHLSSCFPEV